MANKLYEETNIQAIANAIRAKGQSGTMTVAQMASKINAIEVGETRCKTWVVSIASDTTVSGFQSIISNDSFLADAYSEDSLVIAYQRIGDCERPCVYSCVQTQTQSNESYGVLSYLTASSHSSAPVTIPLKSSSAGVRGNMHLLQGGTLQISCSSSTPLRTGDYFVIAAYRG